MIQTTVATGGKINVAGWIVIVLTVVLLICGGSVLGAGESKAVQCNNDCYYSYSGDSCGVSYNNCVDQAARLIVAGIILLIVGAIMSCVSCCVCGGVGCFRDPIIINSPVVGVQMPYMAAGQVYAQPIQGYAPQYGQPVQQGYAQQYAPPQQHQPQQYGQQQQMQQPYGSQPQQFPSPYTSTQPYGTQQQQPQFPASPSHAATTA